MECQNIRLRVLSDLLDGIGWRLLPTPSRQTPVSRVLGETRIWLPHGTDLTDDVVSKIFEIALMSISQNDKVYCSDIMPHYLATYRRRIGE